MERGKARVGDFVRIRNLDEGYTSEYQVGILARVAQLDPSIGKDVLIELFPNAYTRSFNGDKIIDRSLWDLWNYIGHDQIDYVEPTEEIWCEWLEKSLSI